MNILFMGTPDFSVGTLETLLAEGHHIVGAVTQPDKPKGRGKTMQYPPVKETALAHQIPVLQPVRARDPEVIAQLAEWKPDLIVVVAFGQILPKELLELPKYGCINVHASLLPKYRGAAPIQWAVINGEKETGVTIMRMDEGLDTGDMIMKTVIPLEQDETGGSLFDKLSKAGAQLCAQAVRAIEAGTVQYEKQDESQSTYAGMIQKQLGNIDWNLPGEQIERLIRGLNPWPSAFTSWKGKTLKIWSGIVKESEPVGEPSQIVELTKDTIYVQTGSGLLGIRELQPEGKKRMTAEAFLRGYSVELHSKLG